MTNETLKITSMVCSDHCLLFIILLFFSINHDHPNDRPYTRDTGYRRTCNRIFYKKSVYGIFYRIKWHFQNFEYLFMHLEYLCVHKLCKNSYTIAYFRICDRIFQHFCVF